MIIVLDNASFHHDFHEEIRVQENNPTNYTVERLRQYKAETIYLKLATKGEVVEHHFLVPTEQGPPFPGARQKNGVSKEEVALATRVFFQLHCPEGLVQRV